MVTSKTPRAGRDILTASANNLYARRARWPISTASTERYELNSRLVKRDGHLVEEVYRIDGRYGDAIARIVAHLEAARAVRDAGDGGGARRAGAVLSHRQVEDRRAYDIAWVADPASPVDTINGFIEVYIDARGCKGSWEALVFYVNAEKTRHDPDARRSTRSGSRIACRGIRTIESRDGHRRLGARDRRRRRSRRCGADDADWHQPAERPGDSRAVRQQVGVAVERARGLRQVARPSSLWSRVLVVGRGGGRAERWGSVARELATNLHEVIGHGSGLVSERVRGRSAGSG